jgi:serine/threonine-protein kinase
VFKIYPPGNPEKTDKKKQPVTITDDTVEMIDLSEEVFLSGGAGEPYIELGTIGEGGMGEVILAKDNRLLRKVALKILKEEAASPAALSFFLREAQITAQLDHPNIVPLYTVKQPDKHHRNVSFVMKLIRGKTLADIIVKARSSYEKNPKSEIEPELMLRSRLEYFLKACDGIIYAHRKGVIHRDLKPSNIMVGDYGEVYVMDWGIAKIIRNPSEPITDVQKAEAGTVVGTPGYMSPEQAKGLPEVGTESDLFSLGVILYELVTLKPARPGNMSKKLKWAEEGILNQAIHIVPEKKIAPELKAIIRKATAVSHKDRYPNVAALAEDVRCFLRGDEVSQLPDNFPRKLWRLMNKYRYATLVIILSVLLLSSAITIGSLYQQQANLKAAQIREKKLTHLLSDISNHTHYIDSHFMRLEGLLANLANQVMYLIQDAPPNNERFYWLSDFRHSEKAPPDLAYSKLYDRRVSIDYPVAKLAPGVRSQEVMPVLQKLAPLRHNFKKMLLDSRSTFTPVSKEEVHRFLTIHGLPISWAYIGLETGVMYSYPGKSSYSEDYDPRNRPWYELGKRKNAVYWGKPYNDASGMGRVLSCATSLYDKDARFYGVVGMDITLDNIIRENLTRPKAIGVVESFLLDSKAQVIVGSSQLGIKAEASPDGTLELKTFPVKEVVQDVLRNASGLVESRANGRSRLIIFQKIRSLGWYYVEEVDTATILESGE